MMELDVHRLADGILVVFHDNEIGGEALADMSYAQFNERTCAAGVDVPTLQQTLDLCAGRIRLDVELKSACEHDVVQALLKARMRVDDYVVTSFDPSTLSNLRRDHPGVQTGLLTKNIGLDEARDMLAHVAADFWAPDGKTMDNAMLARCEELHIALLPWTVNDDNDLRRFLLAPSVAGVITDHPRKALDLRRRLRRGPEAALFGRPTAVPAEGAS
jgi:glycerophosphoryl diester phosphodiesterase